MKSLSAPPPPPILATLWSHPHLILVAWADGSQIQSVLPILWLLEGSSLPNPVQPTIAGEQPQFQMNLLETVTRKGLVSGPLFFCTSCPLVCVCHVCSAYVSSEPQMYGCHEVLLAPDTVVGTVAEKSGFWEQWLRSGISCTTALGLSGSVVEQMTNINKALGPIPNNAKANVRLLRHVCRSLSGLLVYGTFIKSWSSPEGGQGYCRVCIVWTKMQMQPVWSRLEMYRSS